MRGKLRRREFLLAGASAADRRKDDLFNQRTQVLGAKFGPEDERESTVVPSDRRYSNSAACVGGGTFCYRAMAWRYKEKDFRMRFAYGAVARTATPKGVPKRKADTAKL